jgi:hypothetical protein
MVIRLHSSKNYERRLAIGFENQGDWMVHDLDVVIRPGIKTSRHEDSVVLKDSDRTQDGMAENN